MLLVILFFLLSVKAGFAQVDAGDIVKLTNSFRIENNLSPLTVNAKLTEAAKQKANDMIKNNYWSHVSPTGINPWYWIKKTGYRYSYAGENLAQGFEDSSTVLNAWKKSPAHKKNLLTNTFCQIGVATVNGQINGKNTTVVVQMMACPKNGIGSIIENAKKYILG